MHAVATRQGQTAAQLRIGSRKKVSVPARLTWRDAAGTLRFVSVIVRDLSGVDAYVECQVPASIPLYRLVHFQLERPAGSSEPTSTLGSRKVLSAVYRVGPYQRSSGTPQGYGLRLLVEPELEPSTMPAEHRAFAVAN